MRGPDPLNPLGPVPDHLHPYPFPDTATLDELAARLGGGSVPGVGTLENDTYFIGDSIDVNFPSFLDFVLPSNMVKLQKVALSFKFRLFRAWSVTNASGSTGGGTAHNHNHNHGSHSHSHSHTTDVVDGVVANAVTIASITPSAFNVNDGGGNRTVPTSGNAAGTTPAADATNESAHTHSVTISVAGQINETTSPSAVGITVDGVTQTTALGGPFGGDAIELDITPYVTLPYTGVFHTVQLSTATQGRLMGMLRVTYIANLLRP